MTESIRWGILGTGSIASKFATGLQALDDACLVAVGSRTQDGADVFGERFGVRRCHRSYADLVSDLQVDAVYIATPHPMHKENSLACLEAGKAVLCEKPFAISAAEAEQMVAVARARDIFLMEAMWTRYLPVMVRVRHWLAAGYIGEPRLVTADFGFRAGIDVGGRLFNPNLGGGALLDVGIYTISLASMVLGSSPVRVTGLAHLGETGVDEQAGIVLAYEGGQLAVLSTSIRAKTPVEARIVGTEGSIHIDPPFFCATSARLQIGDSEELIDLPHAGNGYNYEAAEVGACLRAGRRESDIMPLDETVSLMRILDELRAQWGLVYPMEN